MPKRTTTPEPVDTGGPQPRRINIAIPADLHRELRIMAATQDMSIQDTVLEALRSYLA